MMNGSIPESSIWKWPGTWIGLVFLSVLLVLAWASFLERMTCYDPAYFSWLIIDSGRPESVLGRWGSIPSQLIPLAVLHAGGSLEMFLRSYSISFILLYFIFFLIILLVIKDRVAAIAYILVLGPAFRHSFYYSTAELYQGLALSVMLWAIVRRAFESQGRQKDRLWFLAILLYVWITFYHQLMVFPLVFMLGYEFIQRRSHVGRGFWAASLIMLVWSVFRIMALTTSTYEKERFPETGNLYLDLRWIRWHPSTQYFLEHVVLFKALIVFAAVVTIILLWRRRWLSLLWTGGYSLGFLVLILLTYKKGESPLMYENYYTMFGFFGALPFAYHFQQISGRWQEFARWAVLVGIMVLSIQQIIAGRTHFQEKVQFTVRITSQLRDHGIQKAIADSEHFPWPYGWVVWAAPFETALVSALEGPEQVVTIFYHETPAQFDTVLAVPGMFLGPYWEPLWFGTQNLEHRFFQFDIQIPYLNITNSGGEVAEGKISIETLSEWSTRTEESIVVVPVTLRPDGEALQPARSSKGPMALWSRCLDQNGFPVRETWRHTPLEMDIPANGALTMGLVVDKPRRKGVYSVDVRSDLNEEHHQFQLMVE